MKILNKKIHIIVISILLFTSALFSQQSNPWFTTILTEKFVDKTGAPLTGKGVVVGDLDSGIDIFHPMFFFADGGEYDWIDVDGDGKFTPGVDMVDFKKDGQPDKSLVLGILKIVDRTNAYNPFSPAYLNSSPNKFYPDLDFLYIDVNGNGKRDFGEKDGFSESDPTYGEQIFIVIDANKNGELDKGEKLIALKTSKVRVVRQKDGTIRRRGVDLIKTDVSGTDHGTGVSGIILGGHYGVQRLHGIAPDAEIVMAQINYDYRARFVRNFPELIQFIKDEKANIMLFEDGEWGWEFMDGSTTEEEMTNQMARDGITIIGGGGNLAGGKMHIKDTLSAGSTSQYSFNCPGIVNSTGKINDGAYVSFLWKENTGVSTDEKFFSFKIKTPDDAESEFLMNGSGVAKVSHYNIFYSRDISSKGTAMFRFGISEKDSGSISGKWSVTVTSSDKVVIDGFITDVSQSWARQTQWLSPKLTDEGTVTFPSTADSCLAIGAYSVNYTSPGWGAKLGDLCLYSGVGYNISGKIGMDICAPGHTTFTTAPGNVYGPFSGTSSAAPHVVGCAALLLQYNMKLTHSEIRNILHNSATTDEFTGTVPNTRWGWGKLSIEGAIKYAMKHY